MTDIPDWAGKRACELLNADCAHYALWLWPENRKFDTVRTVAKLVMQHEQPPADPDEEAVKRIIEIWREGFQDGRFDLSLARAVSQYKQEKAK